jgi:aldose 1-epimerase
VRIERRLYGSLPDGTAVESFLLSAPPVEIAAITLGAIITSVRTPDRDGRAANVVLGYGALDGYQADRSYLGAVVGRYANRIARGHADIAGRRYELSRNDGAHHLHGGHRGFHTFVWDAETEVSAGFVAVEFSRTSPDGEEGYPGTLRTLVRYELHLGGTLIIRYAATSDAATIVNLTQHTYFNLAGGGDVLDHQLTMAADHYTPVDDELIPCGSIASVDGTPFDFRAATAVGARIEDEHAQLRHGLGYDHNLVLRPRAAGPVISLYAPRSGRTLDVSTTEPGVQLYSGNRLPSPRTGLCLETQHFPDSPHHAAFPSTELAAGQQRRSTTVWHFGVR